MAALALAGAVVVGLGCDSDDPMGDDGGDGDGDGDKEELCGPADLYDDFVVGLEKKGELVTVSFVDAKPAPPIRDINTWTMSVHDVAGDPLDDLEWQLKPWMPDHGHGSPTPITITAGENPGEYVLDPVDLFMAGRWTIDMTVSLPDGGGEDTVQFAFCIE